MHVDEYLYSRMLNKLKHENEMSKLERQRDFFARGVSSKKRKAKGIKRGRY